MYSALQVLSRRKGNKQLEMSQYKLFASDVDNLTQLNIWDPLPIYSFQWTIDLQSTACVLIRSTIYFE